MSVRSLLALLVLSALAPVLLPAQSAPQAAVFGYTDFAAESKIEQQFLAVPDAALAVKSLWKR